MVSGRHDDGDDGNLIMNGLNGKPGLDTDVKLGNLVDRALTKVFLLVSCNLCKPPHYSLSSKAYRRSRSDSVFFYFGLLRVEAWPRLCHDSSTSLHVFSACSS